MSIIKHVTLQKIVVHDFRYDPRTSRFVKLHVLLQLNRQFFFKSAVFDLCNAIQCSLTGRCQRFGWESCPVIYAERGDGRFDGNIGVYLPNCSTLPQIIS